jgi:phosphoglycerate dehydrogenase-like enzyme
VDSVRPKSVGAVIPCPLSDDFDLRVDTDNVLGRLQLCLVAEPSSGDPALDEAEILITGISTQAADPHDLVRRMPRLRWIHSVTAGVDDLVSEQLLERQILLTNGSGAYAIAIAEYAFASMVMLCRGIPELISAHERRAWRGEHALGSELAGKRVGIVGFGGVGRSLARLCTAAGMSVWALRRTSVKVDESDPVERVITPDQLPELLAASDFVVLAASLNPASRGMVGHAEFGAIKSGAFVLNVSRGALIDEAALTSAITSGRVAGAMLDVTAVEPLPKQSDLWHLPNVWITPHMAGGTHESRERAFRVLLANVDNYLAGRVGSMVNVVDVQRELTIAL